MKREELKYFDCNEDSYDSCGFKFEPMEVYEKSEADSVMDALEYDIRIYQDIVAKAEARIKELEEEIKVLKETAPCYEH